MIGKKKTRLLIARAAPLVLALALGYNDNHAYAQKSSPNLESLIQQSGMIFAGKVIDIQTGTKERRMNLYMTTYTFEVREPIYGVEGDTLRIRQYGGEAGGKKFYPPGVPRFEREEEVLVMFYPTSKIGMTSSVGKDQGKFWVQRDSVTGVQTVYNKLKNKGLFKRLKRSGLVTDSEWLRTEPEAIPYDGFLETVRRLAGELKKDKRKR